MAEQKQWFVVQAYSGYEKRVRDTIIESIRREGLEALFGQVLVPTEEVVEMKQGVRRSSQRKFFPGYVLVEMQMDYSSWQLVRNTPRVLGFIGGSSEKPLPISQEEANRILGRLQAGHDCGCAANPRAHYGHRSHGASRVPGRSGATTNAAQGADRGF